MFAAPDYVIRGKTKIDQAWVDDNTEAGIAACGWQRPKNRPTAVAARKASVSQPTAADQPISVPAPPRKPRWWQRWRKPKANG